MSIGSIELSSLSPVCVALLSFPIQTWSGLGTLFSDFSTLTLLGVYVSLSIEAPRTGVVMVIWAWSIAFSSSDSSCFFSSSLYLLELLYLLWFVLEKLWGVSNPWISWFLTTGKFFFCGIERNCSLFSFCLTRFRAGSFNLLYSFI